jgi:hypothetical protein
VRVAPKQEMVADWWGSPWGGGGGDGGSWKSIREGRGGLISVGGWEASREGRWRRTWHTDVDERDGAKSETGGGRRPFYGGPVARKREMAGGLARCRMEGGNGKGTVRVV